jgi:hypothetical protein
VNIQAAFALERNEETNDGHNVQNYSQLPCSSGGNRQAGDLQGLSNVEEADSEGVSELIAEGQTLEAGIIEGVENAPDPDVVQTKTSSRRSFQMSDL